MGHRLEETPIKDSSGIEAFGEPLQDRAHDLLAVHELPETGGPAPIGPLVAMMERPDPPTGGPQDVTPDDAEPEAENEVEVKRPDSGHIVVAETLRVPSDPFGSTGHETNVGQVRLEADGPRRH